MLVNRRRQTPTWNLALLFLCAWPVVGEAQSSPDASVSEAPDPQPTAADAGEPPPLIVLDPEPAAAPPPAAEPAPEPKQVAAASSDNDDITVIGTRLSHTAGSAHVISEKKLERFEYDDPSTVFQSVPGVYSRGEDGIGMRNNIGLRGVNPDRSKKVTLLEDGVLFAPAPYSAPAAYYFPLITRMSGVKVLKGPAAISEGPYTIAGAIDLTTRRIPAERMGMIDVAAGQYGYGKAHVYAGGTTSDNLGFLLEGVHLRNSGFKTVAGGGADTGSARNEWMAKLAYVLDPTASIRQEFQLKATYSDEEADESYLGVTDQDFRENPLQRYAGSRLDHMSAHRSSAVLSHIVDFSPTVSLTTHVYHHHYHRVWRRAKGFAGANIYDVLTNPNDPRYANFVAVLRGTAFSNTPEELLLIGPNERDFKSSGVTTRLRAELSTGPVEHKLEAGARLHTDSVDRRHSEDKYVLGPGVLAPDGGPTITNVFEKVSAMAISLHLADAMTWGPVTLTPGVRAEIIDFHVNNRILQQQGDTNTYAILPGVGAFVQLLPGLGVLAGAYRGFSPPTPPTNPWVAGKTLPQTELDPAESSLNLEAGARYMRGATRVEAIGFFNDYSNLTDICTQSSGCSEINLDRQFSAGAARIYGVEAYAEHALGLGPLQVPLALSYTWTRGEFLNSFFSPDPIFGTVMKGDGMPYLPEYQIRGSVGVATKRISGDVGILYVDAMREQASKLPARETPVHTDAQLIIDLSMKVQIMPRWSVYANLRNLMNELVITGHRPLGARPNAPRWLQIGMKLEL